jgi:hypothetical protein
MRKPGHRSPKLTINAETIRILDVVELERVVGGDPHRIVVESGDKACFAAPKLPTAP